MMGQYYKIVNVDKKEVLEPFDYGNGMKLMEWAYDRNPMVLAMMNLMAERWAGDRVFVISDYACADNPNEPCYRALVLLQEELGTEDLYLWAEQNCGRIRPRVNDPNIDRRIEFDFDSAEIDGLSADTDDHGLRFIVNHISGQYIDIQKCPVEWTWKDKDTGEVFESKIAPLPLLLAIGNGRGGGDFHDSGAGYEYVGSWCDIVEGITVYDVLPDECVGVLDEFVPGFTEQQKAVGE